MSILAAQGETVPLTLVLEDGNAALFPEAKVYNEVGTLVGTVTLVHVSGGLYRGTFAVPTAEKFSVVYTVFVDALRTIPSSVYGRAKDVIVADAPASSASLLSAAVWDEARSGHAVPGSFAEALRVLVGSQGKANARWDQMLYDANGHMTSARIRVFPTAAIAQASTNGGSGQGESHSITITSSPNTSFPALPETVLGVM
jgi:hypothetical protein